MRAALLAFALCVVAHAGADEDAPAQAPVDAPAQAPVQEEVAPAPAEQSDAAAELTPRGRYNLGLSQLDASDFEAAGEQFLAARDSAGPDAELRYRAAFNLGLALANGLPAEAEPTEAIATLRQSAAWFNDAVRLAPEGDDDARINLELVSRRILELADQLNQGNRLEARLDRLIDDQRGVRDEVRRLLMDIAAEQAAAEPLGFSDTFDALASRERALMAEVGDCLDLAAEERLFIEQTAEQERTPEQRSRVHQLTALADYLERARQSLSDTRRRLRRLEGERGHRRADAALAELKRAREQLLDPVQVLQAAYRDELALANHTTMLAAYRDDAVQLDADETVPAWLTDKHLADRQEDIAARSGGVLSQFEAVVAAPPSASDQQDARALQAVSEATPILERGLAEMRDAIAALRDADPAAALANESQALQALAQAIERFAGVKELVELAYGSQQRIAALLDPDAKTASHDLSSAERAEAIFALGEENRQRLDRLQPLLEEEAANAAAPAEGEEPPDEQAQQAAAQRYAQAEELRAQAATSLATLLGEVERIAHAAAPPTDARNAAAETLQALEALRRLFFSITEHIQALHAEQADTHDRTATLQFESSADAIETLPAELGLAAERQAGHSQLGDALADALARQADAAAAAPPPEGGEPDPTGQEAAERLAEAAAEVRKASGRMHGASATLTDAAKRAGAMSPELEPALEDQLAALDHLQNALRTLSPPQNQQNQNDQSQSDGDNQQQAQQQASPEEEQMSQRQALQRLQAIRDREAERRQRRNQQGMQSTPVEKDW